MLKMTEQQKFICDELSHKNRLVRIDKIIKELGVTDIPEFISDLNALEKAGEVILSKKNNMQSVRGCGLIKVTVRNCPLAVKDTEEGHYDRACFSSV